MQPTTQFQTSSPTALRQHIAELNRTQEELKERLRHQELATRNAVGVGILSVVLAAASITMTFCMRTPDSHSMPALAAESTIVAERASISAPTIMVSMR